MPKEQAYMGERAARSSSKSTKDKSNSAALLAFRGRAAMEEEASERASRCSSEKDSGYSDTGSDSLQTDLDDQRSSVSEPQRGGGGGASTGELAPIYIIKNLVLKQPLTARSGSEQLLHGQLTWGGGAGHSSQGPSQLLFIQQPGVASPAPQHTLKTPARKGVERGGNKHGKRTYLPILNSYPRIAPHPSKNTPEQGKAGGDGGASEGQSLSKRVCTEKRREAVSTTSQMHKQHHHRHHRHHKQHEFRPHSQHRPSPSLPRPQHAQKPPATWTSDSCGQGSLSISSYETPLPSSPKATPSPISDGPTQAPAPAPGSTGRQQRFLNTVEILSQSGLLDITLRTQELLRQSAATERDIAQLRHHAHLLCQAAQAGLHAPNAWDNLLQAMAESGRYPSLGCQALEARSGAGLEGEGAATTASGNASANRKNGPVVAAALVDRDNEATPPSPLLAPTPNPTLAYLEEMLLVPPSHAPAPTPALARDHRAKSPPDIVMPPDSSTNGCLL